MGNSCSVQRLQGAFFTVKERSTQQATEVADPHGRDPGFPDTGPVYMSTELHVSAHLTSPKEDKLFFSTNSINLDAICCYLPSFQECLCLFIHPSFKSFLAGDKNPHTRVEGL